MTMAGMIGSQLASFEAAATGGGETKDGIEMKRLETSPPSTGAISKHELRADVCVSHC